MPALPSTQHPWNAVSSATNSLLTACIALVSDCVTGQESHLPLAEATPGRRSSEPSFDKGMVFELRNELHPEHRVPTGNRGSQLSPGQQEEQQQLRWQQQPPQLQRQQQGNQLRMAQAPSFRSGTRSKQDISTAYEYEPLLSLQSSFPHQQQQLQELEQKEQEYGPQQHCHSYHNQCQHQYEQKTQQPLQQQESMPWQKPQRPHSQLGWIPLRCPLACWTTTAASSSTNNKTTDAVGSSAQHQDLAHPHYQQPHWPLPPAELRQEPKQRRLLLHWQQGPQPPLFRLPQSPPQVQEQEPQQRQQQPRQRPCIPFFVPTTPPLDADVPSERILRLCRALCMSEGSTARLALHIWSRITGMVRLLVSMRPHARNHRQTSSSADVTTVAAAAAADRVYSVATVWLAAKLEQSRCEVPSVHTLAAAGRTLPSVVIAAELRVLQWCGWAPYTGFVPDDSHLLIEL
ncbi:hypothetical protein VOLCADRAFT_86767 [Volvox carteri f. nagariensis]|uniref:Uncharacterized protein n=1 Tax=Volvox carteri f. nagariensis TaxID=3068 RepID=D8TJJ6_VOLCA|nr:uncharacterized protein VOLCADRAFT_86767 [Volvox carteri f. nagariensis]EFJ52384.1 hypothetical protein VOLCADRAFT_86767 [Volvox carteri f. nagariensis]|eukprot:XP_002946457.1 hypothetical protein VOLCADRAFT_86767 [Volvox carteri f. nagariensis]